METFQGDCLEIMKGLPDKSIDLFLCDLPYGCLTTPRAFTKESSDYTAKTGKQYDLVIRMRPDLVFQKHLPDFDINKF